MELRDAVRAAVPSGALDALRRLQAVRRAGIPTPLARGLSPEWARRVKTSQVLALPKGSAARSRVVVDVGANEGLWSEAVLELLKPERLIVIEPTPATYEALARRLGGRSSVELHQAAAGDHEGATTLQLFNRSTFNSLLPLRDGAERHYSSERRPTPAQVGSVEVPMTTLDRVVGGTDSVDLLKIDVQGTEMAVLRGAEQVLPRTSVVMLEAVFVPHYAGDALFPELHAHMSARGFELYRFGRSDKERATGRLLFADAIYARPEAIRA